MLTSHWPIHSIGLLFWILDDVDIVVVSFGRFLEGARMRQNFGKKTRASREENQVNMENTGMINGTPIQRESKKLWQYLAGCSACLLVFGVGTALAWTSPVLPKMADPQSWLVISDDEASWISSLLAIGAMIGALPSGSLANKIGRKKAILFLAGPFLLSWLIIILANKTWMLCVARIIVGIGVGATCVLVPTYTSEIAEVSTRGALGALFQLFLTMGIVFGFLMGSVFSYTSFAIVCAIVEVIFLGTFIWMPESPVWLMGQNRKTDASEALVVFRGDAYELSEELNNMQKAAEEIASRQTSIFALVETHGARRALLACFGAFIFQQLSGINAVIFYTVMIFKAAGSSMNPDVAAILVALVQMIMAAVAAVVVDKAGKKPLLMFSSAFAGIGLVALGFYFKLQSSGSDVSGLGWLPLSSLTLFMVSFSIGLGPIPWMLMGELFTVETKATASGLAVMLNWILVFVVTKLFPTMTKNFGEAVTFWIFAIIMAASTVFTFFVVPETKGKTLQAIQDELHKVRRKSDV